MIEPELLKLARSTIYNNQDFVRRLEPSELVNEAYVCLKRSLGSNRDVSFENRRRFYAMVLKVMRLSCWTWPRRAASRSPPRLWSCRSLRPKRLQRENSLSRQPVHEALDHPRTKNEEQAEAIELHYIVGWTLDESAEMMGLSTATLKRQLAAARQWFQVQLRALADIE